MKSLTMEQYMKILHANDFHGNFGVCADWMKRWDKARTDINPNAKWYQVEENFEEVEDVAETDTYIKLDSVIDALIEVSKSRYTFYEKSHETGDALIEAEDIIKALPSIQIERGLEECLT